MGPWISIVITGAAIAGYGMMLPKNAANGKPDSSGFQGEAAYDQLLEDLEAENRELIDAVSKFKREQDSTVDKLSRRIRELELQMTEWTDRERSAAEQAPVTASVVMQAQAVKSAEAVPAIEPAAVQSTTFEAILQGAEEVTAAAEEAPSASLSIKSRYSALLELYERGRSIEQIAKELNMNKGEIQLILQLARREDNQRA